MLKSPITWYECPLHTNRMVATVLHPGREGWARKHTGLAQVGLGGVTRGDSISLYGFLSMACTADNSDIST